MYNFLQMYFIVSIQCADENALAVSYIFVSAIIIFNNHRFIFTIEIANVKDYPIIFIIYTYMSGNKISNFIVFTINV
jgi:hypothetical protein